MVPPRRHAPAQGGYRDAVRLVAGEHGLDESESVEFKKSTGQRTEATKTLCAMLNGKGGQVLFGVTNEGEVVGQKVQAKTLEDLAQEFRKLEPQATSTLEVIPIDEERSVIVATVPGGGGLFLFDGRAYMRSGPTTQRMSKTTYEQLISFQMHPLHRWENQPAEGATLDDLDHEEILRTREEAVRHRSISARTGMDVGEILDRLGLRRDGAVTQGALALFGMGRWSDYPQFLLKMGRFRGTRITGDILHNRQEHMNAFAMMREGLAFLERTLPLASRFPRGKVLREDRLAVPPEALREILLNAIIHRDYSSPSGYVAIAVFDDRVEVISSGLLPLGITVEMLSGPHLSSLRNPKIAGTFQRIGAIEAWGRGTNRVIDECRSYGLEPPSFREQSGMLVVTFRAQIGPAVQQKAGAGAESGAESRAESGAESREDRILALLSAEPLSKAELASKLGQGKVSGSLNRTIATLLGKGRIVLTIPDKPNSRLQKYRLVPRES